ncbi:MAG: sigma-54 dependent transcriptional regulator [Desulfovibrionaceae bacterium]
MDSILIVDDDHHLREGFERLLLEEGYQVRVASSGEQGMDMVRAALPDCVIMDVRMPGMDGLAALQAMHGIEARLPVIIMTAYSNTDTAIEATKLGAFDYVLKPFEIPHVLELIAKAVEAGSRMRAQVALDVPDGKDSAVPPPRQDALVGRSAPMHALYKSIGRVAPTDALVLIRGESGTGKELVARAVYQHSLRARKPFMVINCVAIPDTLLESELFGYEKGAFTGAHSRRIGKIEQASGGTVFLDEIGDMPLTVQAKLLRLLQEKQIERLGGREPISVDVRIIAATNAVLELAVAEGRFREDLYYRLKVVSLPVPPLRDRREDIPLLAQWFLERHARAMDMPNPGLDTTALDYLCGQAWQGNVRELSHALQKALVFSRGMPHGPLSKEDVRQAIPAALVAAPVAPSTSSPVVGQSIPADADTLLAAFVRTSLEASAEECSFDYFMDVMGRVVLREGLRLTGGNRSHAARLLGLSRPTLLARMEKYGLRVETHIL